ncbi:hypothetical protein F4678DRAFT_429309 [Xylaria arbuscula]|nr:hypothetical protein F4678DRAFT_429309 [Xylaria arbuscula]
MDSETESDPKPYIEFPSYDNDNDEPFVPGYPKNDPLFQGSRSNEEYQYSVLKIEDFPPSEVKQYSDTVLGVRDQSKNENQQSSSDKENIVSKLNRLSEESSVADILSWIQECHSLKLKVELNRLARFAVCRNALVVLKYLVEEGKADLSCQDIYGRSAIFYALWDHPTTEMLEYIVSTIQLEPIIMNHKDRLTRHNPLELAVRRRLLGAVEFILGLDLDAETIDNCWAFTWDVVSLFGFKELMGVIPMPSVSICKVGRGRMPRLSSAQLSEATFGKMNEDSHAVWVHIPWANGILFSFALMHYGRQMGFQTRKTDWLPSLLRERVKVASNLALPYTDPLYESNFNLPRGVTGQARSFIVFPCLVLRSRGVQKKTRRRIHNIRAKMTRKLVQSMIQSDRTLDEAYFPSLSTGSLDIRNESQVVSRECTKTVDGGPTDEDTKPILMVSQLWLWRCDRYLLTAFSEILIEYPNSKDIYHPMDMGLGTWDYYVSPGVQTGLFIAYQISVFGKPQMRGKFPSPLDIFEASAAHVLEDVDRYMDPSVSSLPDIRKEKAFMFRIADIREELAMVQEILAQQLEILRNYIEDFEHNNPDSLSFLKSPPRLPSDERNTRSWEEVKSSKKTIENYQKRAEKINRDAERVEKMIQDQLNLKRTYASIEDTRSSIRLGIAGLILSTAVIGFTVITIIFAPLAFVTALFALPIDSLVRNQVRFNGAGSSSQAEDGTQSTNVYTTKYIGTWFAVAEIVSLVITMFFVVLGLWLVRGTESFAALQGKAERAEKQHQPSLRNNSEENTTGANRAAAAKSKLNEGHTSFRRRAARLLSRRKEGESSEV